MEVPRETTGVEREKTFTLVCPKCGSSCIMGVSEFNAHKVRPSVYRWPCLVCERMVEWGAKPNIVLKEPRKLTAVELRILKGKSKKDDQPASSK